MDTLYWIQPGNTIHDIIYRVDKCSQRFGHTLFKNITNDLGIATDYIGKKIAIVTDLSESFNLKYSINLNIFDSVLIFTTEESGKHGWDQYLNIISSGYNISDEKIYIISGGYHNHPDNPNIPNKMEGKLHRFLYFFNEVVENNSINELNFQLTNKPKLFDVLLGGRKPHRLYVYYKLIKHKLLTKSIVSLTKGSDWEHCYFFDHYPRLSDIRFDNIISLCHFPPKDLPTYRSPELDRWENKNTSNYIQSKGGVFYSCHQMTGFVNDKGYTPQISAVLSPEIYNNSWYTIVTESSFNSDHFLTEKTAKPLFTKRIFVLFGSPGILAYLKSFGFKTFNRILDESYDNESDQNRRASMAWEQCLKLASADPVALYKEVEDILEHNHRLIMDQPTVFSELSSFIKSI